MTTKETEGQGKSRHNTFLRKAGVVSMSLVLSTVMVAQERSAAVVTTQEKQPSTDVSHYLYKDPLFTLIESRLNSLRKDQLSTRTPPVAIPAGSDKTVATDEGAKKAPEAREDIRSGPTKKRRALEILGFAAVSAATVVLGTWNGNRSLVVSTNPCQATYSPTLGYNILSGTSTGTSCVVGSVNSTSSSAGHGSVNSGGHGK